MAHYLIFIPGSTDSKPTAFASVQLFDLYQADDDAPEAIEVHQGPGNQAGMVYTWRKGTGEHDAKLGYFPDRQEWIQCFPNEKTNLKAGAYWLGIEKDNPPQPADMVRRNCLPKGKQVTLADGFSYSVPTLTTFPSDLTLDASGEVIQKIKEKYENFYALGMSINSQLHEQLGILIDVEDAENWKDYNLEVNVTGGAKLLASALNLNYRLTFELCFLLKLFDQETMARSLVTFCELHEIVLTQKKKLLADPITIQPGLDF